MINNYTGGKAIRATHDIEKKKTSFIDKQALCGYLIDIYKNNPDIFSYLGLDFMTVYDGAMFQNDELRFFSGEGLDLGNGYRLDSIFLNKYDVCVMSFYDQDDNEIFYI